MRKRYLVTGPVPGGYQWFDVIDVGGGTNTVVATFAASIPAARYSAIALQFGLNIFSSIKDRKQHADSMRSR